MSAPAVPSSGTGTVATTGRPRRRANPLVIVLLAMVTVLGVYQLGDRGPATGAASPGPSTSASAAAGSAGSAGSASFAEPTLVPVDPAKEKALKTKIAANSADLASIRSLSSLYYEAGDYRAAADWQRKIVAQAPKDLDARLTLGTALFNLSDLKGAEAQWSEVTRIAPKTVEAYYNLGFLYLSTSPADETKARAMWSKVVQLAPGSALAKTVSTHLGGLSS